MSASSKIPYTPKVFNALVDTLGMEKIKAPEILINASVVTKDQQGDSYEFVLNMQLEVVDCVKVDSLLHGILSPVAQPQNQLAGLLFELNHVRVNPTQDNTRIIGKLTEALTHIGVNITNTPEPDSIEMCFKPLGQINENVRFYLNETKQLIFLCPTGRPHLVSTKDCFFLGRR